MTEARRKELDAKAMEIARANKPIIDRLRASGKPDKYGYTKHMHELLDLVEDEKPLTGAGFKPNTDEKAYYENEKKMYAIDKEIKGGPFKYARFYND